MKIAKKVLAIAMAVAMIACFAAMAFAADEPTLKLELGEKNRLGLYPVTLTAENCEGLKAVDLTISYNTDVVKYKAVAKGSDASKVNSVIDSEKNAFNEAVNEKEAGKVSYAFNFLEELWDSAKWDENLSMAALLDGVETADINSKDFEVVVIYFELLAGQDIADAVISFEGTEDVKIGDKAVALVGINDKAEEPAPDVTPDAPAGDAPEADVPAGDAGNTDAPSTDDAPAGDAPATPDEAGKDDGADKNGDTGVLAIAAGVVAVAGAAYVVSKKRK